MKIFSVIVAILVAAGIGVGTSVVAQAAEPGSLSYLSKHTTLGMKFYLDTSYIQNQSDGKDVNPTGYGADVKRGYLVLNTAFNNQWSMKFQTDFNYKSAVSETVVYIKNLYLQRDLGQSMKLRIGVADMPWIPYDEGLYQFRYVENTLIDRTHFGNSADWGLHLLGGQGRLNWQVSLVNGGGYKHPGRSKGMDLAGRVDYRAYQGLHLVLGAYTGDRGENQYPPGTSAQNTTTRYDAMVAYEARRFNAGVEYFYASDWATVLTPQSDNADGYSVFGSYRLNPDVAMFARYDYVKPSKDLNPGLKNQYYNVGVQFIASKQIRFAVVYKYSKVDNGFFDTSNGTIGGTSSGKYQEIGLWMQASF